MAARIGPNTILFLNFSNGAEVARPDYRCFIVDNSRIPDLFAAHNVLVQQLGEVVKKERQISRMTLDNCLNLCERIGFFQPNKTAPKLKGKETADFKDRIKRLTAKLEDIFNCRLDKFAAAFISIGILKGRLKQMVLKPDEELDRIFLAFSFGDAEKDHSFIPLLQLDWIKDNGMEIVIENRYLIDSRMKRAAGSSISQPEGAIQPPEVQMPSEYVSFMGRYNDSLDYMNLFIQLTGRAVVLKPMSPTTSLGEMANNFLQMAKLVDESMSIAPNSREEEIKSFAQQARACANTILANLGHVPVDSPPQAQMDELANVLLTHSDPKQGPIFPQGNGAEDIRLISEMLQVMGNNPLQTGPASTVSIFLKVVVFALNLWSGIKGVYNYIINFLKAPFRWYSLEK